VSRVINGYKWVTPEVKKRVSPVVERMKYAELQRERMAKGKAAWWSSSCRAF
jgi:DNA-binding LacI/PurR family transcriptional regulator